MVMEAQAISNITNLQLFGHYYHNKTNNLYIVTKFVKVKQDDTWVDGVEYSPVFADSNGQMPTYVRTLSNFLSNFRNA